MWTSTLNNDRVCISLVAGVQLSVVFRYGTGTQRRRHHRQISRLGAGPLLHGQSCLGGVPTKDRESFSHWRLRTFSDKLSFLGEEVGIQRPKQILGGHVQRRTCHGGSNSCPEGDAKI